MKKLGFTLAEILIVVGVIGVVAALTMPGLVDRSQVKTRVAKVKNFYTTISIAYGLAYAEKKPPYDKAGIKNGDYYFTSEEAAYDYVTKYLLKQLKIAKNCNNGSWGDNSEDCWPTNGPDISLILNDGTPVRFRLRYQNIDFIEVVMYTGKKRKLFEEEWDDNEFRFCLMPDGTVLPDHWDYKSRYEDKGRNFEINYPTQWILKYKNQDYSKCYDYLKNNPNESECE